MEKAAALAIIPHPSIIPQTPTQELQDATITQRSPLFSIPLISSPWFISSRAAEPGVQQSEGPAPV